MGTVKANSTSLGYGISEGNRGYSVRLPLPQDVVTNTFKSLNRARQWQLVIARTEWGLNRFQLIKRGRLSILRKFGNGVSVRKTKSKMKLVSGDIQEYIQYGVFWYEHDGSPKSVMFSYKKYGDDAEIEAHWFAAKQRAKLTESELNLPSHWHPRIFDLEASVQIKQHKGKK